MTATMVMASEAILDRKEELAREITQALYDHEPGLLERHGERGRSKCLQDMRYNLEHLAPAVGLDDPALFARYVTWLDQLLRPVANCDWVLRIICQKYKPRIHQ